MKNESHYSFQTSRKTVKTDSFFGHFSNWWIPHFNIINLPVVVCTPDDVSFLHNCSCAALRLACCYGSFRIVTLVWVDLPYYSTINISQNPPFAGPMRFIKSIFFNLVILVSVFLAEILMISAISLAEMYGFPRMAARIPLWFSVRFSPTFTPSFPLVGLMLFFFSTLNTG